jgi:Domain of unknown function (DUF3859)
MKRVACAGILYITVSSAAWAAGPACEITSFGIFGDTDLVGARPAPGAAAGRERLLETDGVTTKTTTIPGRLGLRFGVTHHFHDIPPGEAIEEVIRHPPLPRRGGGTATESRVKKDPSSFGSDFGFDYPHEIVPGEWSFEFYFGGQLLCRQSFQVVVGA